LVLRDAIPRTSVSALAWAGCMLLAAVLAAALVAAAGPRGSATVPIAGGAYTKSAG
jgi:hypothetical protein